MISLASLAPNCSLMTSTAYFLGVVSLSDCLILACLLSFHAFGPISFRSLEEIVIQQEVTASVCDIAETVGPLLP